MKLHLGCGQYVKDGFINIDLGVKGGGTRGGTMTVPWDLSNGLPKVDYFGDIIEQVDYIYSSHFFEHLFDNDAFGLMRECYDVLKTTGRLRILVPDFKLIAQKYLADDTAYFDLIDLTALAFPVSRQTRIDHMTYCVYQSGEHKSIWDLTKMTTFLKNAGFGMVMQSKFSTDIDPPDIARERYSLIVEAVKL